MVIIPSGLFSQSWRVYNSANSPLPENTVYVVYKDNAGNIWFGTDNGLARLSTDSTWQSYTSQNSALSNNSIRALIEDAAGALWIGTVNGGLCKLTAGNITVYDPSNSSLPDYYVRSLEVDSAGYLWIGTTNGLARFNGNQWKLFTPQNSAFISANIPSLKSVGSRMFAGSINGGLAVIEDTTVNVYTTGNSTLPDNSILSIDADNAGQPWLGSSANGISYFLNNNAAYWYYLGNSGIPSNTIHDITIDDHNRLWLATSGGLGVFDGTTWKSYTTFNSSLPNDDVRTVCRDKEGKMWIGTYGGGAAMFDSLALQNVIQYNTMALFVYPSIVNRGGEIRLNMSNSSAATLLSMEGKTYELTVTDGKCDLPFDLCAGIYVISVVESEHLFHSKIIVK
jgi:ligand-binding sensor domain-containing protein